MTKPLPIMQIAGQLKLAPQGVEPFGWFKGKLALGLERRLPPHDGVKYVGVTAMSPTPLGEGKTVTAIGLAMALCREGHSAIVTLRQPSQGPVFGIKGGGAGGGLASLWPADDVNLHFTGDMHAVTSAHNLLAALIDNHVKRHRAPLIDPGSLSWKRVIDLNDKGLARMALSFGLIADDEPGPGDGMLESRPDEVDLVGLAVLGYGSFGPPW